MPRSHSKKPVHLEVIGLAPFPSTLDEWERALIEPVLARLFEEPKQANHRHEKGARWRRAP
ncbi:MAG: hypothetical protein BGO98_38760 [Myxococcales bacterium 68-20]|nr:MAG: hypothetical protein BGO98_38760 [Myxococcales bacterium 68-20]